MLCSEFALVKQDREAPEAVTLFCKRWSCPDCRPKRQAEVRALCRAGEPKLMITLTSQLVEGANQDAAARDLVRAWQLIVKRYKRLWDVKRFPYFAVVEETKRGQPHLHILARAHFINHKWLSEQLADITGSYVVWLTAMKSFTKAANYVSKYLGKAPTHYEGCKRYWRSQDWITDREAWDARKPVNTGTWCREQGSIHSVVASFKSRGYHVVWLTADHALFMPGTDHYVTAAGSWAWRTTEADRQRQALW